MDEFKNLAQNFSVPGGVRNWSRYSPPQWKAVSGRNGREARGGGEGTRAGVIRGREAIGCTGRDFRSLEFHSAFVFERLFDVF